MGGFAWVSVNRGVVSRVRFSLGRVDETCGVGLRVSISGFG